MRPNTAAVFCCLTFCAVGEAQQPGTDLVVKVPMLKTFKGSSVDQVRVVVDGRVKTATPGQDLTFNLPSSEGDNLSVDFSLINKGFLQDNELRHWRAGAVLNGSGHADYIIDSLGAGAFEQYPAVVCSVRGANLDLAIDGKVWKSLIMLGTPGANPDEMAYRVGLLPKVKHILEWRDHHDSQVCIEPDVTLPPNVTRRYLCDAKTRKVEEN